MILCFSLSIYSQTQITLDDLQTIVGNGEGSITYLDCQTNKPFAMAANFIVEKGKSRNSLVLNNIYSYGPKANNRDKIKVIKNGIKLNKHIVIKREELENESIQIQAQCKGKNDNKKALIRYTYLIGENIFVIKKEVQFEEVGSWIKEVSLVTREKVAFILLFVRLLCVYCGACDEITSP